MVRLINVRKSWTVSVCMTEGEGMISATLYSTSTGFAGGKEKYLRGGSWMRYAGIWCNRGGRRATVVTTKGRRRSGWGGGATDVQLSLGQREQKARCQTIEEYIKL